jgi:hypothetical protein
LTVEVGGIHLIEVHDGEVSDARAEQCFRTPTTYATHTKEYHACVLQRTKAIVAYELGSSCKHGVE